MCPHIFDITCLVPYILRCTYVLSCFSHVWLFEALWTVACQAPLSMGFSKQESWSGLPCPPPGNLSHPGVETASRAAPALLVDSLPLSHQGSPPIKYKSQLNSCYCWIKYWSWPRGLVMVSFFCNWFVSVKNEDKISKC